MEWKVIDFGVKYIEVSCPSKRIVFEIHTRPDGCVDHKSHTVRIESQSDGSALCYGIDQYNPPGLVECLNRHSRVWKSMNAIIDRKTFFGFRTREDRAYFETYGHYPPMKEILPSGSWKLQTYVGKDPRLTRISDGLSIEVSKYYDRSLTGYRDRVKVFIVQIRRPTLWEITFRNDVLDHDAMMEITHCLLNLI